MRQFLLLAMTCLPALVTAQDIPFYRCFDIASQRYDIPLDLIVGVARVESGFDPSARSDAGAHGIMQIRWPVTARHLGVRRVAELYNPCVNIDLGAGYLAELLHRYDGNTRLALAAYNYGPTRLRNESDIPASVDRYVHRVNASKPAMRTAASGQVVVNLFARRALAEAFATHLTRLTRHGAVEVVSEGPGRHLVLVHREKLTRSDVMRLDRLYGIKV